jgi:hypothetical protein
MPPTILKPPAHKLLFHVSRSVLHPHVTAISNSLTYTLSHTVCVVLYALRLYARECCICLPGWWSRLLTFTAPTPHPPAHHADLAKNQPGSYYHLRKPETSQLAMSFPDWLAAWQSWKHSRLLLQVRLALHTCC